MELAFRISDIIVRLGRGWNTDIVMAIYGWGVAMEGMRIIRQGVLIKMQYLITTAPLIEVMKQLDCGSASLERQQWLSDISIRLGP